MYTTLRCTLLTAIALATAAGTACAAGPEEVFTDAAMIGELDVSDFAMLGVESGTCIVDSGDGRLLCVTSTVAADKSARWDAVVVGAKGIELSTRVLSLTAAAAKAFEDPTEDVKGWAKFGKSINKINWRDRALFVVDFSVKDGVFDQTPKTPIRLSDGRTVTVTTSGLTASDGTVLNFGSIQGRTWITVYALYASSRLVAVLTENVNNVTADRFVISEAGTKTNAKGPKPNSATTTVCPNGIWCPPNYATLAPLLDRFCSDDFGPDALAATTAAAADGTLGPDDLSVFFNAYGALYGYEFKKLPEYNRFFYGQGAAKSVADARAWLPKACREAFGRYTTKNVPKSLRKARDQIKQLWTKHK